MTVFVYFLVVALVGSLIWQRASFRAAQRDAVVRAAERHRRSLDLVFAGVHAYREATARDWAGFDRDYARDAAAVFERDGFAVVGDLVDDTVLRAFPNLRHVSRLLVGDGGRVRVAITQVRVRGVAGRLLQLVGKLPRRIRAVDCTSELDGSGRFVTTASTLGLDRLTMPEAVSIERLSPRTPAAAVLARHRERLAAMDRAVFVVMAGGAEVLASMQRANVLVARFREGVGPLTEDELKALRGRALTTTEELFVRALRGEKP